ncbi:hypothetical protein BD410DRAFT_836364 [Rickenella mellea]|uniref:Uncharacterized protein n=1 Tax=Rickenella mellea TaxID=50990 RepID=A0A4Y7QGL1_9AGAM|nr:hypothetical protein BD410DRAFT_836364 [Rickenella mellea]
MSSTTSNAIADPSIQSMGKKRQYASQAAKLAVGTVTTIADGLNVPFLGAATHTLNQIIVLADTVKANREACMQLATQATDLVQALVKATEGKSAVNVDDDLKRDLGDLGRTLESIRDCMVALSSRSRWKRILSSSDDGAKLTEFRNRLTSAVTLFQIRDQISGRISQEAASQELLQNVKDIQAHQLNALPAEISSERSELLYAPPAYPECFYGRDEFVSSAVDLILNNAQAKLAILGPGGIGKTTVASAIFNNPQIQDMFPDYRIFVSCESLSTAESLLETLCKAFNLSVQNGSLYTTLKDFIQSTSTVLVVLDNFETLWDTNNVSNEIESLLKNLCSLKSLSTIVTMRGSIPPIGIHWTKPALPPLSVLSIDAAKLSHYWHIWHNVDLLQKNFISAG